MSKVREQNSIPVTKVQRASKFIGTGAKMGRNYLKYYATKLLDPSTDRSALDEANATDLYNSLSELKGSALKVAQMMSMDDTILPPAYAAKFQMAQYNAPPLSYPLVVKTFKKSFNRTPEEIFDTFSRKAVNAASIGQVHKATLNGKAYAVKVQYPGVADSVSSDLRLAKPIAMRLMNIKGKDLDTYMNEVETRLLEETDYELELQRSMQLTQKSEKLAHLIFPKYYPEHSSSRIITMDWIDGVHLSEWMQTAPSQDSRNRIGQALWDFYDFQIHELKEVHADPHPGNFIITSTGELGVIDFGCVKLIPNDFYQSYFKLLEPEITKDKTYFLNLLQELNFFLPTDTAKERQYFTEVFTQIADLLGKPFASERFDFSDKAYFAEVYTMGERISTDKEFRKSNAARGSHHAIYVNRSYFGLYNLLHQIGAVVNSKIDQRRDIFRRAS